jgi:hypothetical protein
VLHGRTDLTVDGERWLQWAQIERGDFHSSLRIVADRLNRARDAAYPALPGTTWPMASAVKRFSRRTSNDSTGSS